MLEAHLGAVHDQTHLASQALGLAFEQAASQGLVPLPNADGGVVHESAEAPDDGGEGGLGGGDLVCDLAQMNRTSQEKAHQEPAKVANAGLAFLRTQLYQQISQATIESVDRHGASS